MVRTRPISNVFVRVRAARHCSGGWRWLRRAQREHAVRIQQITLVFRASHKLKSILAMAGLATLAHADVRRDADYLISNISTRARPPVLSAPLTCTV